MEFRWLGICGSNAKLESHLRDKTPPGERLGMREPLLLCTSALWQNALGMYFTHYPN